MYFQHLPVTDVELWYSATLCLLVCRSHLAFELYLLLTPCLILLVITIEISAGPHCSLIGTSENSFYSICRVKIRRNWNPEFGIIDRTVAMKNRTPAP